MYNHCGYTKREQPGHVIENLQCVCREIKIHRYILTEIILLRKLRYKVNVLILYISQLRNAHTHARAHTHEHTHTFPCNVNIYLPCTIPTNDTLHVYQ